MTSVTGHAARGHDAANAVKHVCAGGAGTWSIRPRTAWGAARASRAEAAGA